MAELRIPQILEKQLIERKNKTQIAEDLGVNRKTITRDTQSPLYQQLRNEYIQPYLKKVVEFMNHEQTTLALEGTKELGRTIRKLSPTQVRQTQDTHETHHIIIEDRRRKEDLVKSLELTPDQYRVLEDAVKHEKK